VARKFEVEKCPVKQCNIIITKYYITWCIVDAKLIETKKIVVIKKKKIVVIKKNLVYLPQMASHVKYET